MSFTQFMDLVPELQEQVVRNCEARELLVLAQTCSSIHGLAIRALYHHVDISTHHIAGLFQARNMFALAENPIAELPDEIDHCIQRQRMFVRSMKLRPEYGAGVTRLTWTYFSQCNPKNDKPISDKPMWRALQRLTSVKYLDFASIAFQRERDPPPALFPVAEHIRLIGPMSFAFVRAILFSGQAERLVSLDLDNVLDLGQYKEGKDFKSMADLSLIPESADSDGTSVTRHPGNMRGHLQHLVGRCPRLKYFVFGALATTRREIAGGRQLTMRQVIEQGLEPNQTGIGRCRPHPIQLGRPMDDRVLNHLLPALLTRGFAKLKELRLYGIGANARPEIVQNYRSKCFNLCQDVHEKLLAALGPGVKLEVREHATKTFFYYLTGNTTHGKSSLLLEGNSVVTQVIDGTSTVLPLWYCDPTLSAAACQGCPTTTIPVDPPCPTDYNMVLVLPPVVLIGVYIPPPPGLPTLKIGSDGVATPEGTQPPSPDLTNTPSSPTSTSEEIITRCSLHSSKYQGC
ncbi:hypothetical protein DL95DRAFT_496954 [Leptodontidium sp. 2 PMI_412]|nr:hypothetical protein DL95DRAFT_496954 [Leptodontidium sp. 2 PMI_412]